MPRPRPAGRRLIAGSFSHEAQVVSALAAAVLVASLRNVPRASTFAPILILAISWFDPASDWHALVVASAAGLITAIFLVLSARRVRSLGALVGGVTAMAIAGAYVALQFAPEADMTTTVASNGTAEFSSDDIAGTVWAYRNNLPPYSLPNAYEEFAKIPYEVVLIAILAAAFTGRPQMNPLPTSPE